MGKMGGLASTIAAFFGRARESDTGGAILSRIAPSALYAAALIPVMAVGALVMTGIPGEYNLFGPAGHNLITGHWNLVFVNNKVQAGAFEVLPYGLANLLHLHTALQWYIFYISLMYVMTFLLSLVLFIPIRRVVGRFGRLIPFFVLGLALLGGFIPTVVLRGHPAEAMIPMMWIVAGAFSRERMFAAAGVTLALSTGFEVWGVLGVPVLFLATSPRVLRAAVAAVCTVAVLYLPFVATGTFAMFQYKWTISIGSLYRTLWPHLDYFPWTFRLAQAVLALVAGVVVARLTRKTVYGLWLVPLAIIGVRLTFDPLLDFYYWMAPATVGLCALAATLYLRKWLPAAIALGLVLSLWIPPNRSMMAAVALAALVALCVFTLKMVERRGRGDMPQVQSTSLLPRPLLP